MGGNYLERSAGVFYLVGVDGLRWRRTRIGEGSWASGILPCQVVRYLVSQRGIDQEVETHKTAQKSLAGTLKVQSLPCMSSRGGPRVDMVSIREGGFRTAPVFLMPLGIPLCPLHLAPWPSNREATPRATPFP